MKRIITIALLALLAVSLVFAQGNAESSNGQKTYNFKVSITQSATDPLATYTQQWIKEVEEKTKRSSNFRFLSEWRAWNN